MKKLCLILLLLLMPCNAFAQAQPEPPPAPTAPVQTDTPTSPVYYRHYKATLPVSYSPEIPADLGIAGNQLFQDLNNQLLDSLVPGLMGDILSEVWSTFWTYEFTIWSHEFGHWTRAAQVDSQFIFYNLNPLLPHTTVEMPDDASLEDQALLSVGGFEVNSLIARKKQIEFYTQNYAFADELVHAWVNKSFFPVYAFLVIPRNPELPETWQKTAGDPVHFVLPTYQRATGKDPVTANNTVQQDLIDYYHESIYLSIAWELLDPIFYQTLWQGIISKPENKYEPLKPMMLLGDEENGWTYGTLFNPSPLGYELYLYNYLKLNNKLYALYLKYGRPMQNLGLGVNLPELVKIDDFTAGLSLDLWQQDTYNLGLSVRADTEWFFTENWGIFLNGGWKSAGYLLGQPLDAGPYMYTGISYRYAVPSGDS